MYGGLAKKDKNAYPVNPKTGLAVGDMKRMSFMFIVLAIMGVIGSMFLPWFEGDWGNDWYLEAYGFEGFLDTMLVWIQYATITCAAIGIILFLVGAKIDPNKAKA
jgi:hypothetical protein